MSDNIAAEPVVFQIEEGGYGVDITPSYTASMRRLLHRATDHPKYAAYATKVAAGHAFFSQMDIKGHCDVEMASIRHALAVVPGHFVIAEHRLRENPAEESLVRRINVLAEFDPTFEVLLRLHCVRIGELGVRKASKEVASVIAGGMRGLIRLAGSLDDAYAHLRDVQLRTGGIDFLSGEMTAARLRETLPVVAQERFRVMAGEMGL
ncbi:hypothetical protein [Rhizobium sp. BK176]|uniref:hypothetical protein n=1 Tax=Rhizobium sp. BK176 TaxID=2587071 RepID=UPI002168E399|nr:hypothetical protein [Rhizobium sp. BK176]MCS4088573.1 hypothetical protein [Rhizobium sp. BK176]